MWSDFHSRFLFDGCFPLYPPELLTDGFRFSMAIIASATAALTDTFRFDTCLSTASDGHFPLSSAERWGAVRTCQLFTLIITRYWGSFFLYIWWFYILISPENSSNIWYWYSLSTQSIGMNSLGNAKSHTADIAIWLLDIGLIAKYRLLRRVRRTTSTRVRPSTTLDKVRHIIYY